MKSFLFKNIIYQNQLYIFLISTGIASYFLYDSAFDRGLSNLFYTKELSFIYRDHFIAEKIFHKGGVWFIIINYTGIIGYIIYRFKKFSKEKKIYLITSICSALLSIIIVAFFKKYSTFPCPWDSNYFGSHNPTPSFSEIFSSHFPNRHCFPSGHSSGGYSLLAFYVGYFVIYKKIHLRWLFYALFIGAILGFTQIIRGAHFLSHDFATITIVIFTSLCLSHLTKNFIR